MRDHCHLAFKGIFAHSYKPLRLITIFGIFLSCVSFISLPVLASIWLIHGVPFAGFGTLISLIVLAIGLLFLMLGVVAEYVGLIYEEVKARPNYVISGRLN